MAVSAMYIGKSGKQISELLQMFCVRLMVGNRKDLCCFVHHFVQMIHIP